MEETKEVKKKTLNEVIGKLPFTNGAEKYWPRLNQAIDNKEIPIEVNCFNNQKIEILRNKIVVRIYNEKIHQWQNLVGVEYKTLCPVCGRLILVRAIEGSTWFPACSTECYDKVKKIMDGE